MWPSTVLRSEFTSMSNSPFLAFWRYHAWFSWPTWSNHSVDPTFMTSWEYEIDTQKYMLLWMEHLALQLWPSLARMFASVFGLSMLVGVAPFFLWPNYAFHLDDLITGYKMLRLLQFRQSRSPRLQLYPDWKGRLNSILTMEQIFNIAKKGSFIRCPFLRLANVERYQLKYLTICTNDSAST
jgi:hypothetical protein